MTPQDKIREILETIKKVKGELEKADNSEHLRGIANNSEVIIAELQEQQKILREHLEATEKQLENISNKYLKPFSNLSDEDQAQLLKDLNINDNEEINADLIKNKIDEALNEIESKIEKNNTQWSRGTDNIKKEVDSLLNIIKTKKRTINELTVKLCENDKELIKLQEMIKSNVNKAEELHAKSMALGALIATVLGSLIFGIFKFRNKVKEN